MADLFYKFFWYYFWSIFLKIIKKITQNVDDGVTFYLSMTPIYIVLMVHLY